MKLIAYMADDGISNEQFVNGLIMIGGIWVFIMGVYFYRKRKERKP